MVPHDLHELLDGFVAESLDNLDDNENRISRLGLDDNIQDVEAIFRVFHTLKGLSGFFELNVIQKVTHTAETLLDAIRTEPRPLSPETIDLLFIAFDFLQNALKYAAINFNDDNYQEEALSIIEQLKHAIFQYTSSVNNVISNNISTPIITNNDNIKEPTFSQINPIDSQNDSITNTDDYQELLQAFVLQTNDRLEDYENLIDGLSSDYYKDFLNEIFRTFHSIKGPSSLLELNVINKLVHNSENLLEKYRTSNSAIPEDIVKLIASIFQFLKSSIAKIGLLASDVSFENQTNEFINIINSYLNNNINNINSDFNNIQTPITITNTSNNLTNEELLKNNLNEVLSLVAKLEQEPNNTEPATKVVALLNSIKNDEKIKANNELQDIISSMITIWESIADASILIADVIIIIQSDLSILVSFINPNNDTDTDNSTINSENKSNTNKVELNTTDLSVAPTAGTVQAPTAKPTTEKAQVLIERKEVRVSTDKLNKLFDLVGEIITIESMVVNNKNLIGLRLPDFQIAANMLNKLIRELQKITMSMRMIPLEGLFNKMNRLVRDISRKFNKDVVLEIYGQDTEMDKNVIEQLSDPLVHMIRNSIDHGIEDIEKRTELGKPIQGLITLGASYQGNEIHITVEDDGGGLNKKKILEKARDRGLLNKPIEEITDKEAWLYIFEPGLSTAKEVTDISGRGVGMDVVKKNIEKLRGSIDVDSKPEHGTKITFRIPLTLAILDAMLVRVGNAKYALPILSVKESFQPKPQDITITMDGIEVVKVRNELFQVIRLHEIMRRTPDNKDLEKGILMILNSRGKKISLFVDEILGQQQAVVKPLSEYIGDIEGVTGCMVMADGKIGLILDVDNLVSKAESFKG